MKARRLKEFSVAGLSNAIPFSSDGWRGLPGLLGADFRHAGSELPRTLHVVARSARFCRLRIGFNWSRIGAPEYPPAIAMTNARRDSGDDYKSHDAPFAHITGACFLAFLLTGFEIFEMSANAAQASPASAPTMKPVGKTNCTSDNSSL
jgi:hypothetical protein